MKRKEFAAWLVGVVLALFGGGFIGTLWAQMLCALVAAECTDGPAVIGGFVGLGAAFMTAMMAGWRAVDSTR